MGELIHLKSTQATTDRVKISKSVIDAFKYDPDGTSWQVIWDSVIENLGVRVRARSKNWVLRYRNDSGKQRLWTIGATSKITVRKARELAENANARIVLGEDPSAEKQARRDPDEDTFRGLARQWLDEYSKLKRKSWREDESRLFPDTEGEGPIEFLALHDLRPGHSPIEEFEDVLREAHAAVSERAPVSADRAAQVVGTALNWHVKRRRIPRHYRNICQIVDMNGHTRRKAWLRPTELATFAAQVANWPLHWRAATWFTLFTGSRMRSETLKLPWKDVHLDAGEFTYQQTKSQRPHTLPITPTIRAIFDVMPRNKAWVFPSPASSGTTLNAPDAWFRRRVEQAFVEQITPHALRHTTRTYLQTKLRVPGPTVDAVLNHSTQGMAGTYTHVHLDDVRAALEDLEVFVLEHAKIDDFAAYLGRSE